MAPRGDEVLYLAAEGWTDKQIADRLFISPRTVEGHWRRLREKTGQPNRSGVIGHVLREKLADAERRLAMVPEPSYGEAWPNPGLHRIQSEVNQLYKELNKLKEENQALRSLGAIIAKSNLFAYRISLERPHLCLYMTDNIRTFGYEPEDFAGGGMPVSILVHPEDFDTAWGSLLRQIEERTPTREVTYRVVTSRGDVRKIIERSVIEPENDCVSVVAFDVSHLDNRVVV